MTDNITLPRAVVEQIREAWSSEIYPPAASIEWYDIMDALRAALDAALAEPEQKPTVKDSLTVDAERYRWLRGEVQGPHTPLAQVVWKRNNIRESGDWTNLSDGHALDEAIDAALAEPPAKPEPVAWLRKDGLRFRGDIEPQDGSELPLYAAPPAAAKPEPATREQVFAAYNAQASGPQKSTTAFYRDGWQAAERFHGITKEDKA